MILLTHSQSGNLKHNIKMYIIFAVTSVYFYINWSLYTNRIVPNVNYWDHVVYRYEYEQVFII